MGEEEENSSKVCIDCGARSPPTNTAYTLISSRFGWRLSRRRTESGELVLEWRCPECWAKYKRDEGTPKKSG